MYSGMHLLNGLMPYPVTLKIPVILLATKGNQIQNDMSKKSKKKTKNPVGILSPYPVDHMPIVVQSNGVIRIRNGSSKKK